MFMSGAERLTGKTMAIGTDNFRKLREKTGYYVDKTRLIARYLEAGDEVTLLTRPRRFGKTLNISMLAEFFDITKDSREIFDGTEIMGTKWTEKMNSFPIIALSFADVKGEDADTLLSNLCNKILWEYRRYSFLWEEGILPDDMRRELRDVFEKLLCADDTREYGFLIKTLRLMCSALDRYYGKRVYVFIDEYDTPFIHAMLGGFYREVRSVLSLMLESALKGNIWLESAYLTGIQRVAKENVFSGLNNITVCTVNDSQYADCFGFTEQETESLLKECGLELTKEVKSMYNGYCFGGFSIYNPWSITNYAKSKKIFPYWVNTSENGLIRSAMGQIGDEFFEEYDKLIAAGEYEACVKMDSSFYESPSSESLWGLLLNAGMVTADGVSYFGNCILRVPNREVMTAFQELTAFYLGVRESSLRRMFYLLMKNDMPGFLEQYRRIILHLPSYHDLKDENSYHMMMLGMCTFLTFYYEVYSNREQGLGRSDIFLRAREKELCDIIIEFKYTKDEKEDLKKLAEQAVRQIEGKSYAAGAAEKVLCIGLGHRGKEVEMECRVCMEK